jgi:hypothetical protein
MVEMGCEEILVQKNMLKEEFFLQILDKVVDSFLE